MVASNVRRYTERADEARELTALVDELGVHDSTCSPQEYVTGDDNLPVCDDAGDDWDEHFLVGLS